MENIVEKFKPLFSPRSVAFVGASNRPGKWGSIILGNLMGAGFEGRVYPVNPKEKTIQGLRAYRALADIPDRPDLAVIVVPPPAVSTVIDQCITAGVKACVVITAGFAELDEAGARLQQDMVEKARAGGLLLVGPNCNGIMSPPEKLHVAMPPVYPPPGQVAIVAQSGNVATSIARRVMKRGFGVSRFVSSGNEAVLHCEDYLAYLADDPRTRVILSYVEGFRDGRRFLEIAGAVSRKKPIVILKAGGTEAGARAAMSHTAALAGSDATFDAVCRQAGVVRARDMDDLVNMGVSFVRQPLPGGRRAGIITAGGGWGVLAADACVRAGLQVPTLPPETLSELDTFLPPWWNRGNPVDLVAGLQREHLWKGLECLLRCDAVDGIILLGIMPALPIKPLPPRPSPELIKERQADLLAAAGELFDRFMEMAHDFGKPVVVASEFPVHSPDLEVHMAARLGEREHVCYARPEDAATVLAGLAAYAENTRHPRPTPDRVLKKEAISGEAKQNVA